MQSKHQLQFWKKIFLPGLFVWAFSSCISESFPDGPSGSKLLVGDSIPDFTVITSGRDTISKKDLSGKNAFIIFFHTGCKDCQKELPILNAVYLNHQNDSNWLFLCIGRSESDASVGNFWKQHELSLPYAAQTDSRIYSLFAYDTVPLIYVVDRTGIIKAIYTDNPLATQEELEEWLEQSSEKH